jgi:hypothetical protein
MSMTLSSPAQVMVVEVVPSRIKEPEKSAEEPLEHPCCDLRRSSRKSVS